MSCWVKKDFITRFRDPLVLGVRLGGTGEEQNSDEEVQQISDEIKPYVEDQAGRMFDIFIAKSYRSQRVAGRNYFIKVHVGGDDFIHLRVNKTHPSRGAKLKLRGLLTSKAHYDAIEYFDPNLDTQS